MSCRHLVLHRPRASFRSGAKLAGSSTRFSSSHSAPLAVPAACAAIQPSSLWRTRFICLGEGTPAQVAVLSGLLYTDQPSSQSTLCRPSGLLFSWLHLAALQKQSAIHSNHAMQTGAEGVMQMWQRLYYLLAEHPSSSGVVKLLLRLPSRQDAPEGGVMGSAAAAPLLPSAQASALATCSWAASKLKRGPVLCCLAMSPMLPSGLACWQACKWLLLLPGADCTSSGSKTGLLPQEQPRVKDEPGLVLLRTLLLILLHLQRLLWPPNAGTVSSTE